MALFFTPVDTTVLRITGEDALTYLQGQCTADLRSLSACHALWLNRKGRVLAHTLIVPQVNRSFLVLAPHRKATELISIITANLIADDVQVIDETLLWQRGVVWGQGQPEADASCLLFPSHRCGEKNWELLAPLDFVPPWPQAEEGLLEQSRVLSGVPSVPQDCGEQEFPQECGLEAWVSYQKGCYCGQEMMARIHAMGTLRRTLRRVSAAEAKVSLKTGLELKNLIDHKVVGVVRSASAHHGLALVSAELTSGAILSSDLGPIVLGEKANLVNS